MEVVLVVLLVAAVGVAAWLLGTRRATVVPPAPVVVPAPPATVPPEVVERAVAAAVAQANQQASAERDQAVKAAVDHALTLVQAQLGATTQAADAALAGRQQLIDAKLGEVQAGVQGDLQRLAHLVQQLGQSTSERLAVVDHSLQAHAEITQSLAGTANSLREALASSNARGQWGERMAEDVLRLAGMQERVNYVKRTAVSGEGTGIPDFTFLLPKGHVLFMDVKFPMAAYLKYLEAGTEAERSAHRAAFVRDVRARVRELAKREYARVDDRPAVDNVLLFVPNESLAAFIHEADGQLVEDALRERVVICSPLTLFAFLGVIRQAFDNFMIEQTSQEILGLLGKFSQQWEKYTDSVDKVKRQFDGVARAFDELTTTRRRALERPLTAIEDLRRRQSLPVDGQLFGTDELDWDNVRELGA
ncbi:MAG: DNA recombination protein RmuC [Ilumatobacteraceae bacterium]|nr:DNA recombination protein RmuC [Ilumatobacter sp.]